MSIHNMGKKKTKSEASAIRLTIRKKYRTVQEAPDSVKDCVSQLWYEGSWIRASRCLKGTYGGPLDC